MLYALSWIPAVTIFSGLLLVSSVAVWISHPRAITRMLVMTALLLAQSSTIALATISTPLNTQVSALTATYAILSLQWALTALACVPKSTTSSEVTEPTE